MPSTFRPTDIEVGPDGALYIADEVFMTGTAAHVTRILLTTTSFQDTPGAHHAALAAAAATLVFAVHPVVTEAVCEPTFREDLLVALFTLAGLRLAMGRASGGAGDGWRAAACIACSLLAIGSKESGIAAPAAEVSSLTPTQTTAAFDAMIAAIRDPASYAVWQVPVVSGRVPA